MPQNVPIKHSHRIIHFAFPHKIKMLFNFDCYWIFQFISKIQKLRITQSENFSQNTLKFMRFIRNKQIQTKCVHSFIDFIYSHLLSKEITALPNGE